MIFYLFLSFIIIQRCIELIIAKRNEIWMKKQGAIEVGQGHYPFIVAIHTLFFLFLIFEVVFFEKTLVFWWPILGILFVFTQFLRVWALLSLGKYWNTKIIILPNASIVKKGPYHFLRHPNYAIVILEILLIPLLFGAYLTAGLFTILNAWILSIRIQVEEEALMKDTNYQEKFNKISRFTPFGLKKV